MGNRKSIRRQETIVSAFSDECLCHWRWSQTHFPIAARGWLGPLGTWLLGRRGRNESYSQWSKHLSMKKHITISGLQGFELSMEPTHGRQIPKALQIGFSAPQDFEFNYTMPLWTNRWINTE